MIADVNKLSEMVSIPWEEYKELLMIKGRYEELKERKFSYEIDWGCKDSTSVPIKELSNPIARYPEWLPRIEAEGK